MLALIKQLANKIVIYNIENNAYVVYNRKSVYK